MSSFHNAHTQLELDQLGWMLCPSPPLDERPAFSPPGGTMWMGSLLLEPGEEKRRML